MGNAVGIIANPVSARDIRRVIANATALQITDRYVGVPALRPTETFRELFVTFAGPEVIGMSAIAGLLKPVTRPDG